MSVITAERLNELKALIKAECQRRQYTGSVADYGSTSYDFATKPAAGGILLAEHYSQNLIPMNAINSTTFPLLNNYKVVATEEDIALMETSVAAYAGRVKGSTEDNTASDCAASCTGLCHSCTGNCVSGCTSCTGCSGSCGGNCTGSCRWDCSTCAYYWGG